MFLRVSLPLENLSPVYISPSTFSSHKVFPQYQFLSIPQNSGGRKKLSKREEKHVDAYMVMNINKNKTRTKYYKEVS